MVTFACESSLFPPLDQTTPALNLSLDRFDSLENRLKLVKFSVCKIRLSHGANGASFGAELKRSESRDCSTTSSGVHSHIKLLSSSPFSRDSSPAIQRHTFSNSRINFRNDDSHSSSLHVRSLFIHYSFGCCPYCSLVLCTCALARSAPICTTVATLSALAYPTDVAVFLEQRRSEALTSECLILNAQMHRRRILSSIETNTSTYFALQIVYFM